MSTGVSGCQFCILKMWYYLSLQLTISSRIWPEKKDNKPSIWPEAIMKKLVLLWQLGLWTIWPIRVEEFTHNFLHIFFCTPPTCTQLNLGSHKDSLLTYFILLTPRQSRGRSHHGREDSSSWRNGWPGGEGKSATEVFSRDLFNFFQREWVRFSRRVLCNNAALYHPPGGLSVYQ